MRTFQICLLGILIFGASPSYSETVVQNTPKRLEVSFDFLEDFQLIPTGGPPGSLIDVFNDAAGDPAAVRLDVSVSTDDGGSIDDFLFVDEPILPGESKEFSQNDFTNGLAGSPFGLNVTALRISRPLSGAGWQASLVMAKSGCNVIADFSAGTLNLNFDLATDNAATWTMGAFIAGSFVNILSVPLPAITPVVSVPIPVPAFPDLGTIAFVSILSEPKGVTCFDFDLVDTSP